MTRLAMPDSACKSVDVPVGGGRKVRYQPDASGSVEVSNPRHARLLREQAECFIATGHTIPRTGGYICESCSFRAVFTTCSRCGGVCSRASAGPDRPGSGEPPSNQ